MSILQPFNFKQFLVLIWDYIYMKEYPSFIACRIEILLDYAH
jgi:hypothetical protein